MWYLRNAALPLQPPYAGFDYHRAGSELALRALERGFSSLCLLTGSLQLPNESDFFNGFMSIAGSSGCRINHIQTDPYRKLQNIMQMFGAAAPQAIFISNYGFAESVKDIWNTFYSGDSPEIYTVSPMFTMPENDFQKYELNYRQLGKGCGGVPDSGHIKRKKGKKSGPEEIEEPNQRTGQDSGQDSGHPCLLLENSGFRDWFADILIPSSKKPLNVLTLDSPSAYTMRNLSRIYTKKTGVPVNITIYSYEEIYEAFNHMHHDSVFDVLRLDVTWLSWFADKILQPLDQIDPGISSCLDTFLDGTINQYSIVRGRVYAPALHPQRTAAVLPPRTCLKAPIYRRMYHETYRQELRPPQDFKEFNQIARFFTKACTPSSPVEYGATMTLGSTGVAGSEYLARLFSHQENLYNEDFQVTLNSPAAIGSLRELIALKEYSDPQVLFLVDQHSHYLCRGQCGHGHPLQQLCLRPSEPFLPGSGKYRICPDARPQSCYRRRFPGRVQVYKTAGGRPFLHQMDVQRTRVLRGHAAGRRFPPAVSPMTITRYSTPSPG